MKAITSLLLFIILVNVASCQSSGTNQSTENHQGTINSKISVDEFDKKLGTLSNAQLVDVRTPEEYAEGHLNGAININIKSGDFNDKISKLEKNKPVLVYCLSGGRSSSAAGKMEDMGFTEIYNMDGGIMKWENAGKPLAHGEATAKPAGMTTDEFNKLIAGSKTVLVDYNAKWCEPCKKMLPILESLAQQKKDKLTLIKIDADDNKELLNQKGISGIPYLELYQDGKLTWKHEGYIAEDQLLKETRL